MNPKSPTVDDNSSLMELFEDPLKGTPILIIKGPTVDDTNPALPIIRNIYHNSRSLGSLRIINSRYCL